MRWIKQHLGAIGLILFVVCVIGGFNVMQDNQLEEARNAAILVCDQENFRALGEARTVRAQKIVNRELALWLTSSAAFRHSQGEHELAKESEDSRDRVKGASALLVVPRQIDCSATYDSGKIVYRPAPVDQPQKPKK